MTMTTEDEEDFSILKLANEKGKFGLEIGAVLLPVERNGLERGMDNDWFTLIDVSPIAESLGVFRVFKLTAAGKARLNELKRLT